MDNNIRNININEVPHEWEIQILLSTSERHENIINFSGAYSDYKYLSDILYLCT